jgi:hypothetical protein
MNLENLKYIHVYMLNKVKEYNEPWKSEIYSCLHVQYWTE